MLQDSGIGSGAWCRRLGCMLHAKHSTHVDKGMLTVSTSTVRGCFGRWGCTALVHHQIMLDCAVLHMLLLCQPSSRDAVRLVHNPSLLVLFSV